MWVRVLGIQLLSPQVEVQVHGAVFPVVSASDEPWVLCQPSLLPGNGYSEGLWLPISGLAQSFLLCTQQPSLQDAGN